MRAFLKFDVSSIPSDAAINSAKFRIYMHSATPSGDSDMRVESRHLGSDWSQCSVTWNSHQPDWGPVYGESWIGTNPGWLEFDVTDIVRDWVYGTHANYGLTVMGDETVRERQRMFYSSRDTGGNYPRLVVDYTLHVDNEPPVVAVDPLPQWSDEQFTVTWSGYDPGGSGIAWYDVEWGVSGQPWNPWLNHTTTTSSPFYGGANGTTYQFRARGVDNAGNVQDWSPLAQAWTTVDAIPPTASANPLDLVTFSNAVEVSWGGTDNSGGSGIANYDVQYQENGGPWLYWLQGTSSTSAIGTGLDDGATYGIRVRATDNVGNVQPWDHYAQTSTLIDTQEPLAWVVPFDPSIIDADQFMVTWDGDSSPNTTITSYNVRWKFRSQSWVNWLVNTTQTEQLFSDLFTKDGWYCFEVSAMDSAGRSTGYMGESCATVDRNPPYMQTVSYLPLVPVNAQP